MGISDFLDDTDLIHSDYRIEELVEVKDNGDDRLTPWEYDFIESIELWVESKALTPSQEETVDRLYRKYC